MANMKILFFSGVFNITKPPPSPLPSPTPTPTPPPKNVKERTAVLNAWFFFRTLAYTSQQQKTTNNPQYAKVCKQQNKWECVKLYSRMPYNSLFTSQAYHYYEEM
jgi:hypothetical protein